MKYLIVGILALFTMGFFYPTQYRVCTYETRTIGTKYGVECRKYGIGSWQQIIWGADTPEMAQKWAKQQPVV